MAILLLRRAGLASLYLALASAFEQHQLARLHATVEAGGEVQVSSFLDAKAKTALVIASFLNEVAEANSTYDGPTDELMRGCFVRLENQHGSPVDAFLVTRPMNAADRQIYEKYRDKILFLGISSFNEFPFLAKDDVYANPTDYEQDNTKMFPGWLHMLRDPEKHFPANVKTLLLSESDFMLPDQPARDFSVPKKYDFTYSASDCDVLSDGKGWCGWSKGWEFVKQALPMMCDEFNLIGVLVATKDKSGKHAYTIPESCKGKMIQTTYLAKQQDFYDYLKQSRFVFLPQIHDASPRVSTQALAFDVPILMNSEISGGWKYLNNKTGEFFHGMTDFREALRTILKNSDIPGRYEPRKFVLENYGTDNAGKRLLDFVVKHFSERVHLPEGTTLLKRR